MSIEKKLKIIAAIDICDEPNIKNIEKATGVTRASIRSHIKNLRSKYYMDIRFIRKDKKKPGSWVYSIYSWGIFNVIGVLTVYGLSEDGKITPTDIEF